ncbi:esterase-like activity of phytase family protein [Rhodoplanes sp. SY1]|uniref:esterase-like activity of phytase family protein n=1 Tax=Rhodoplanes sp. SY1 TaxID=3166646 RepID=UPI0038B5C747
MIGRGRTRIVAAGIGVAALVMAAAISISAQHGRAQPVGATPQRGAAATAIAPARHEAIEVEARPLATFEIGKPNQVRFGRLQFRGGVELTSRSKSFGGISGLVMLDDARFLAVTDKAAWLTGRIVYQGQRPVGVADAVMSPIMGPDGRTLAERGWYDTEAVTADRGIAYVGIERANRIVRFEFGKLGTAAPAKVMPWPAGLAGLPNNRGVEALVAVPRGTPVSPLAGALIVITERALDPAGNVKAALLGGPRPGLFTVARHDGFDISDAALLPDGDLLLLERRFTWTTGVAMRLRRIPIATIAPGAVVDGPVLITADMGFQIDNMEALGVHVGDGGETVLTLVSDDNFSFLQRTVLLQFTLLDE